MFKYLQSILLKLNGCAPYTAGSGVNLRAY